MNIDEIQKMFSEMGLENSEQRDRFVKEFSISIIEELDDIKYEIEITNNTLIDKYYAQLARHNERNK